ncbi:hypothetical protein RJL32_003854 [Salmonella enterica]|nr:hypothetical protein [Salmonella enterica]
MKHIEFTVIACVFFSCCVKAETYRNYLWRLDTQPRPGVVRLSFDDYTSSANGVIRGLGGIYSGTALASACKTGSDFTTGFVSGNKTNWVLLPKEYTHSGLRFTISNIGSPWMKPTSNAPVPSGYSAWISQVGGFKWYLGDCYPPGFRHSDIEVTWRDLPFTLNIKRSSVKPGYYKLQIPFYYGFEENKSTTNDNDGGVAKNAPFLIKQLTSPLYIPVEVDIRSKCNFNTSSINLSHGTMVGRDADGNQTKPYNLNISCSTGTSLSIKLIGTQNVSGKTNNYTRCGSGGMCELTFDNGKYDETISIDNNKILSIISTYRLNDITKPVAESFEGSGVLQVLVN